MAMGKNLIEPQSEEAPNEKEADVEEVAAEGKEEEQEQGVFQQSSHCEGEQGPSC